ncbi:ATP-binding protein [Methylonatrum kenyense]|uniref:ATP-binding protein n=1 Tax=Methylonatrum kenyense TaxID=455253 RepID=UPI0020BEBFF5|nr:ATP-binding protein [Methylonatrum kenyense]MCK8516200.1 ATP-binding protein [Methylonatrum kenyense]
MDELKPLLAHADRLLYRLERLLPEARDAAPDWTASNAFRWYRTSGGGHLHAIPKPHAISASRLQRIDRQRQRLDRNTRQFVNGLPANNALLWGSRGTGKSSLVKAMLQDYAAQGLRLIEVSPADLVDLPWIIEQVTDRPERFILFCDDLSFEADDPGYKALKASLDGSLSVAPENLLIYATSNRRHLLPESMRDNLDSHHVDGELHHGEAVEEKISLSERFGLWIAFRPFDQDAYLDIVDNWLRHYGLGLGHAPDTRERALRYALERGSRSGRVAAQFARDYAGLVGLEERDA